MESHSFSNAPGVAASGMALRQAREARGLGVAEIAGTLKLTSRQIEAIESESFDMLPGIAFARGFVRNYARYLGLDPAPLLERMEQPERIEDLRLAPESNAEGAVPTTPAGYRPTSALPALAVVGVIVVLGVLGATFGWFGRFRLPATEKLAAQSEAIVATSEPAFPPHTEETAVVTAQVEPAAATSAPTSATPAAPAGGSGLPAAPVAEQSAPGLPAAQSAPQTRPAPPPASATVAASAPAAPAAPATQTGLSFSFEQDAWVEVRDSSGGVVFSRLSKAGTTQSVQGTPPFALVIGNAPNVKVQYNGRPVDLVPYTKVSVARLSLK